MKTRYQTLTDVGGAFTGSSLEDVKRYLYWRSTIGVPSQSERDLEALRERVREEFDEATMCGMERFTRKVCRAIHEAIMAYPVDKHQSKEYHRLRELSREYNERLTRYEAESDNQRKQKHQRIDDWLRIAEEAWYHKE